MRWNFILELNSIEKIDKQMQSAKHSSSEEEEEEEEEEMEMVGASVSN